MAELPYALHEICSIEWNHVGGASGTASNSTFCCRATTDGDMADAQVIEVDLSQHLSHETRNVKLHKEGVSCAR